MLAPCHAVEFDTDVGQQAGGLVDGSEIGVVGQLGCIDGDGAQHAHVAQAAVALLQVRLEEEGHVSAAGPAGAHLVLEEGEVLGAELVPPGRLGLLQERFGDSSLTPDHARIEQAKGHADVLGGDGQHLLGAADRVIELDALVPDRVPDPVGDGLDVPVAGVDEDDVEIAVGAQRLSPVAADGQKGQVALGVLGRLVGQLGEPGVGLGGVAAAEFLALESGFVEEPAPPVTE